MKKKINPRLIAITMMILSFLALGGIATTVQSPGGFEDGDPGTAGGG